MHLHMHIIFLSNIKNNIFLIFFKKSQGERNGKSHRWMYTFHTFCFCYDLASFFEFAICYQTNCPINHEIHDNICMNICVQQHITHFYIPLRSLPPLDSLRSEQPRY